MRYCKAEGVIAWSGGTTLLRVGMSFDDDHPLVAQRPELFGEEDPGAEHKSHEGPKVGNVERATAAPGEVRQTPGTGPRAGVRKPGSAQ